MERVIMLKWFKTMKNRLFGEEENDENKTIHTVVEEQDEEVQEIKHEKPVFRFPIITDAEIYGWDEDEIGTSRLNKKRLFPLTTRKMIMNQFRSTRTRDGQKMMYLLIYIGQIIRLLQKRSQKSIVEIFQLT